MLRAYNSPIPSTAPPWLPLHPHSVEARRRWPRAGAFAVTGPHCCHARQVSGHDLWSCRKGVKEWKSLRRRLARSEAERTKKLSAGSARAASGVKTKGLHRPEVFRCLLLRRISAKVLAPSTNLPRSASRAPRAISLRSSASQSLFSSSRFLSKRKPPLCSSVSSVVKRFFSASPCLGGETLLFAIPAAPRRSPRRRLRSVEARRRSPRADVFAGIGAAPCAGSPCRCRGRYARA